MGTSIRKLLCMSTIALLPATAQAEITFDLENGKKVYDKRCSQCHGDDGAADGPGAPFMRPRPRVFKENAAYKFRSTPSGELPTRTDVYRVILEGIPGTSMPGFPALSTADRWDLVAYLETFAEDFNDPELLETSVPAEELTSEPTPSSPEAIARGKELYIQNKCEQCHGVDGRGNGPSWPDMKDDWGNPILPANLHNKESYRNGRTPQDVFRTITTGLNGTPMPAYRESADVAQRWDMVHYILSLGPPIKAQRDETVAAIRVEAVPESADDEIWASAPSARFKTVPNIIEPPRLFWTTVEYLNVQAVYSPEEIALRITWDDRTPSEGSEVTKYEDRDTKIYQDTNHSDQFAVQFAVKDNPKARPYFLLGDAKRPVNLWWWRADTKALIERNGKGALALSDQSDESQTVQGTVTFEDGRYTMFVRRTLETADTKRDVQFTSGKFAPIAFHVWDGSSGEIGARHALTTWYWLYLAPEPPNHLAYVGPIAFGISFIILLLAFRRIARRKAEGATASSSEGNLQPASS